MEENGHLRGAIDSLNTAIKMLGLNDMLYLNISLGYTGPLMDVCYKANLIIFVK